MPSVSKDVVDSDGTKGSVAGVDLNQKVEAQSGLKEPRAGLRRVESSDRDSCGGYALKPPRGAASTFPGTTPMR